MTKGFVIGSNKCLRPSYDAEQIEEISGYFIGEWSDGNPNNEDRTGRFVTSSNNSNKIELANADSYIAGVSEAYEGSTKKVKVNPIGLSTVQDDGTLSVGDKCMPSTNGIAKKSNNNLGYRVVARIDDTHVQIIASPNNDMIQRIKNDYVSLETDINKKISNESSKRTSQYNALNTMINQKISTEVSNRKTADNDLSSQISSVNSALNTEVSDRKNADNALTARMDTFTSLANGSTTGDAELADIRVKADGTTASNAGTAVREQIKEVNSNIDSLKEDISTYANGISYSEVIEILSYDQSESTEELKGMILFFLPYIFHSGFMPYLHIPASKNETIYFVGTDQTRTIVKYVKPFLLMKDKVNKIYLYEKNINEEQYVAVLAPNGGIFYNMHTAKEDRDFDYYTTVSKIPNVGDTLSLSTTERSSLYGDIGYLKPINLIYDELPKKVSYVIAQDGSGDFETITEAVSKIPNGSDVHILLKEGVYEEIINLNGKFKNFTMKGVSRDLCIIRNTSGKYKNSPFLISGNFQLENISFQMTTENAGDWIPTYGEDVFETYPGYALHIDSDSYNKEAQSYGLIKNCNIYSEAFPAVGMGMNKNQKIEFQNCYIARFTTNENYKRDNWKGSFLCHSSNYADATNQNLYLINNIFECNYGKTAHIRGELGTPEYFNLLAINNTFYSKELGFDSCEYVKSSSKLSPISHGNTATNLNSNSN